MRRSNGGIIGPDNVTTGGFNGVASGVWKLNEVTDLIKQSKWPEINPFPTNITPNSLRFNTASSDSLSRTQSASPTSATKGTLSFWIKRSLLGTSQYFMSTFQDSNNRVQCEFQADNTLRIIQKNSSATTINIITNRVFTDPSAFYHVVLAFDTTQDSSDDRVKLYINGVRETSFSTNTRPSLNIDSFLTKGTSVSLGAYNNSGDYTSAYFSEMVLIDGQQLTPTSFGETNSDSGIWIPKTITGLTFGTNGYYLKFTNSGALGEDFSGEDNDFTLNNLTSIDQASDSPSNNFPTFNPLVNNAGEMMLLSDGNTSCQSNAAQGNSWKLAVSTFGIRSGKWYWEAKLVNINNNNYHGVLGSNVLVANSSNPMNATGFTGWNNGDGGEILKDGNNTSNDYGTLADNDILGVALNADDYTISIYKNGSALVSNFTLSTTGRDILYPCSVAYNTNNTGIPQSSYNFGNPAYALTSAVADANGLGNFEYAPPTGYFSLCTNNLNVLE